MDDNQELRHYINTQKRFQRMPVIFIGHGNPMNAIEDNHYTQIWRDLGSTLPKPKAIVVISAHWVTQGSFVTAMPQPKMIYDMYGFPDELYQVQYPAPGSVSLARQIHEQIPSIQLDTSWGFDHGTWSVLLPMYPEADVPVIQISVDYNLTLAEQYQQWQELKSLRDHGILFIGSGNMVHNLNLASFSATHGFDWAIASEKKMRELIEQRDHEALIHYENLGKEVQLAIPTEEHYRPLLGTLALSEQDEELHFFNQSIAFGSVSMLSCLIS